MVRQKNEVGLAKAESALFVERQDTAKIPDKGNAVSLDRHNPLKVVRWSNDILAVLNGETRGPIRANLDLDNRCQDKCWFCEPKEYRADTIADKNGTLPFTTAEDVLDDLHDMGCQSVTFSGGGEPTLHPQFGTLLAYAKHLNFRTYVITNGGFIDKWMVDLLVSADHIRVSLDASNEQEHRLMHGAKAGQFEKVVRNIRDVVDIRWRSGHKPEIGIAYVVDLMNCGPRSLERAVGLAAELGVDYLHFRPVSDPNGSGFWPQAQECIEKLIVKHPNLDIWCLGKRGKAVFEQRGFDKCYASLTLAVIGASGDVQACCDQRSITFGNVNERRFKDIWLSEVHRTRAAEIVPAFCQRCLMCNYNKSVQDNVVNNEALVEMF